MEPADVDFEWVCFVCGFEKFFVGLAWLVVDFEQVFVDYVGFGYLLILNS